MISRSSRITIPAPVERKLEEVRVARDRARLATVAVIGLLTLLLAMSLAMLVDWSLTLFDPFWRSLLTGTALLTVGVSIATAGGVLWRRGRRLAAVAQDIDRAIPRIEERWWTVAELAAAPLDQQRNVHTGMMSRLSRESAKWETHVSPEEVVSLRGLLHTVLAVCAVVLLLLTAFVVDWQQSSVLVKRFWAPTANISATQLEVPESDLVTARGEPLLLDVHQQGRLAEEATLVVRAEADLSEEKTLLSASGPDEDRFVHRIKSADESFRFRLRAGDGQSRWVGVTVADRPELAAARFRAVPPEYTGRDPVDLNELPGRIKIVEGSRLEVALLPRADVDSVKLKLADDHVETLAAGADGWHRFRTTLNDDLTMTALLTETHGLQNKRPPVCRIEVYRDQPPAVDVASPTDDMAARPDDEIEIDFTASDDFGIAKAELVIYEDPKEGADGVRELQIIDIPLGEQDGATTVNQSVPLDLSQFNLEDGQSISYAVRVYDTRESVTASAGETGTSPDDTERSPVQLPTVERPSAESSDMLLAEASDAASQQSADPPGDVSSVPETAAQPDEPNDVADAEKTGTSSPAQKPAKGTSTKPGNADDSGDPSDEEPTSTSPRSSSKPPTGQPGQGPSPSETDEEDSDRPAEPKAAGGSAANDTPPDTERAIDSSTQPGDPRAAEPGTPSDASPGNANSSASQSPIGSPPPGDGAKNSSEATGAPRPSDEMTRRSLDVAQSASSGMMRLNIDKWAGSFAGRQREKLEIMISPRLEELDQILARAENRLQETLQDLERDVDWAGPQDRVLGQAEGDLTEAIQVVADLNTKTAETPYAFIGLQLAEIAGSHIVPANESVWMARQAAENTARQPPVESAWQQTARARQRLKQLVTQYERVRRDHRLTDAIQNIKTMYQAFVEDSFELLEQQKSPINNYQRRMAELEVDEEYLRRLEEVLKMRQKLIAEFARILSADPRLLRRFVDSINSQSESLRDQLTLLALGQQELDEELRTWVQLNGRVRDRATSAIIQKKLRESIGIAEKGAQLQERFQTWSPLDLGIKEGDLSAASDRLALVAAAARQLEAKAAAWRPEPVEQTTDEPAGAGDASKTASDDSSAEPVGRGVPLEEVTIAGRALYEQLRSLDGELLELSGKGDDSVLASFLVRRLAETRELIALTSGWVYRVERLDAGDYPGAAAVEQHQLAEETNQLTADLSNLEQQLSGVLQREDGTLPPEMAELARKLFGVLENDVGGSQLGAVFALRRNKLPTAAQRTKDAAQGFVRAEELFDELIKRAIDEADKLPVQDPIADLLDDPTLDELLALLENEQDLATALGIPVRPTNIQTIGDWFRRGNGGGGGIGSNMIMAQLSRQQLMLNRAAERAANRARAEADKLGGRSARRIDEWNVLASQLENKLLQGRGQQPPERYRRAIEQYFEELSRQVAGEKDGNP